MQKIKDIEDEVVFYLEKYFAFFPTFLYFFWREFYSLLQMARTQKNKATAHHLGLLKVSAFIYLTIIN